MNFLKNFYKKILIIIGIVSIPILIWLLICFQVPSNFPAGVTTVHIAKNSSISAVASDLYSRHIINSEFIFKVITKVISKGKGISAGDYRFTESQNVAVIAYRMINGQQGIPKIKITIPEGTNVSDMAYIFMTKLENFDAPHFVSVANKFEGFLFPDTYHFLANTSSEQIINIMLENFDLKIKDLKIDKNIIILASIVEEEAIGMEDKRMVAGILQNRIDKGMLLQVDPPFYYITGKTGTVTFDDLKIDSPYNTYKYKGLPKGPISNPGLESIKAVLDPIKTSYYFYLTGKDGVMRYATTYEGHLANKNKYLN